jgi:membrane associated rhomboid family serine protease
MRHGEWWRSVTALTLHADAAHFVSNAVIGGIFIYLLSREIKSGPAWLLFIASGFLGNMINAWARGPGHLSLGASTGVFGIVAAITAFRITQNKSLDLKNTLVPCAAGLAILGLLGTAGERTDVLAHLFGFLSGLPLGALTGLAVKAFGPPREAVNKLTGFLAAYVPFYAWTRALQGFEPNPLSFF